MTKEVLIKEVSIMAKKCLNCKNSITRLRYDLFKDASLDVSLEVKHGYTSMFFYDVWVNMKELSFLDYSALDSMLTTFKKDFASLKAIRADLLAYKNFMSIN